MKAEGVLLKNICPKWLQLSAASRLRIGSIVMVASVVWCAMAPFLSGNNKIAVHTEFSSYWLTGIAFIYGAGNYFQHSKAHPMVRLAVVGVLLILSFVLIFESSHAFFFWKVRSMRPEGWSETISSLGRIKEQKDEMRSDSLHRVPPIAARRLGLPDDYLGRSDYDVTFGYKPRIWGVFEGSEESLDKFCQGCKRVQVERGVYFFVGSKD